MKRSFVVIGGGVCSSAALQTLREEGFDGRIVLVGDEAHVPYERPPLSKEYLQGREGRAALPLREESWYEGQEIELRLGVRVVRIEGDRTLILEDGERLAAEAILIATGGRPRRFEHEPSDRILYLRTIEDADRIRSHLSAGTRLLVVGAGFIGAEVAASARSLGADVTIVEVFEVPLERALGREMGRVYAEIHREHGVDLRTGAGVESVVDRGGTVVVRTSKGDVVEGDVAVIGVGIQPNVEVVEGLDVRVENGIVVDELCRTSMEGVFAAGDVANHFHPVFERHVRVEHFDNALKQGAAAARSMLGGDDPYDDPHWFWSDQYEHNLQYAGYAETWDEIVVRGSIEERSFAAFYLQDGILRAALGLNRGKDVRRSMKLIAARARPDPAALRDADADLRALLPPA